MESIYAFGGKYDSSYIRKKIDNNLSILKNIDTTMFADYNDMGKRIYFTQQQLDETYKELEKFIYDNLQRNKFCHDSDISSKYISIQQDIYEKGNFAFIANELPNEPTINDVKIKEFSKNFENGDVNDVPIIKKIIDKKLDFLNGTNTTYASTDLKNDDIVYFSQSQLCVVDNKLKEYINKKIHNKELCFEDEIIRKKIDILQDDMYKKGNFAFVATNFSDNPKISDIKIKKISKNFEADDIQIPSMVNNEFLLKKSTLIVDSKEIFFTQKQLDRVKEKIQSALAKIMRDYDNRCNNEIFIHSFINHTKNKLLLDEYRKGNFAFILPEKIKGKPSDNKVVVNVELGEAIAILRREYEKDFERSCYNVNSFLKIEDEDDGCYFSNSGRGGRRNRSIEGSILLNLSQNTHQFHNSNIVLGVTKENVEDKLNNLSKTSPYQKIAIVPFRIEPNSSDYPDDHEVVLVVDMNLWSKGDRSNSVMVYDSSYTSLYEKYNKSFAYGKKIINHDIVQRKESTCSFWAEAFASNLDSRVTKCRINNLPCIKQIVNEETFMKGVEDRKNSIVNDFKRGEKLEKTNDELNQELYLYKNVVKRFVGGEKKLIDISSYGNCK